MPADPSTRIRPRRLDAWQRVAWLFEVHPQVPCPFPSGDPPGELWSPSGTRPIPFNFPGVVPTIRCFMAPCLACEMNGWVAVLPDGTLTGYCLAYEIGCDAGCDPLEVASAHLSYLGELPPREPVEGSEADRAYVAGAARHAARRIVEADDPLAQIKREARTLGSLAAGYGVELAVVARALAAIHAGVPLEVALPAIRNGLIAGATRPRRKPS